MPLTISRPPTRERRPSSSVSFLRPATADSMPQLPSLSSSSFFSPVSAPPLNAADMARVKVLNERRIDGQLRRQQIAVEREWGSIQKERDLNRRDRDVKEFEERRKRAYLEEAERRATEREERFDMSRASRSRQEERRVQAAVELEHSMERRDAMIASRNELKSREQQQWAQAQSERFESLLHRVKRSKEDQIRAREEELRQRDHEKRLHMQRIEQERAESLEADRRIKAENQARIQYTLAVQEGGAREHLLREQMRREYFIAQRKEADAQKREQAAERNREAAVLVRQRRKALFQDREQQLVNVQEEMQRRERRKDEQLKHMVARQKAKAAAKKKKELETDLKLKEQRRRMLAQDEERHQKLVEKQNADTIRGEARMLSQAQLVEAFRKASEVVLEQKRQYLARPPITHLLEEPLEELSHSLSESQLETRRKALEANERFRAKREEVRRIAGLQIDYF